MDKFMKINEVANQYKVTKRTLRYYEEIGLIKCNRDTYSNYRYYDDASLKRLEQIMLLRAIDFNLNEIKEILLSNEDETINLIFEKRLKEIQEDMNSLRYFQKVVSSIIRIRQDQGVEKVNLYEILREQVYINKKLGGIIEMSQYVGDTIIVEFGMKICDVAQEIIQCVKKLRVELETQYGKEIPLVRIRDVMDLKPYEYRIVIKTIVVKNENLEGTAEREMPKEIIHQLKDALIRNMETIETSES